MLRLIITLLMAAHGGWMLAGAIGDRDPVWGLVWGCELLLNIAAFQWLENTIRAEGSVLSRAFVNKWLAKLCVAALLPFHLALFDVGGEEMWGLALGVLYFVGSAAIALYLASEG